MRLHSTESKDIQLFLHIVYYLYSYKCKQHNIKHQIIIIGIVEKYKQILKL